MKYAFDVGTGVIIYIPSFIKICSEHSEFHRENTQTNRQEGDCISLL
jgi:hypothetical protein